MLLTVIGSANDAGIPVHGCLCTLCRQARAVRHLRRRPGTLLLEHQGERLLIEAGATDLDRRLSQDPVDGVLLSSWSPTKWHGLLPLHLGAGPETPVFGPSLAEGQTWLQQQPGRLLPRPALRAGQETLVGRFRILPFGAVTPNEDNTLLAYGIRDGEHRLAYLPCHAHHDSGALQRIAAWQPDAVIAVCPTHGAPRQRLQILHKLHDQLGRPAMLLTGLDHHMDHWLQAHTSELPTGMRVTRDDQRLEPAYLAEYQRLASFGA